MKSIYGKLITGFFISLIFSFSIAGFFSLSRNSSDLSKLNYEELGKSSDYIVDLINSTDKSRLPKILEGYCNTTEISFRIESNKYNDEYGQIDQTLSLSSNEKKQLYDNVGKSIFKSKTSLKLYSKSYVINDNIYIITILRDSLDRDSIYANSAAIAMFCFVIAGSIMFLVIADIIVKPISRLTKATNELSKGNYRIRVNYNGKDEIAALNQSFNQMAQQLAKSEETRQQFISDVSHEFQTPLTAITGFATILKNEKLTEQQRQKYIDIILFHSKRLSTLSKNMLQLTILEGEDIKLNKTEFSLTSQLLRVIEVQDALALKKNIEIEFNHPKGDITIEADEDRLEQVWINLINNAIKYTNEGGVVTIDVKKTTKEIEVMICDTGVGMSKDAISHIFERFYRQDKSRNIEGNGLGLSIVKRIVDLHEGVIDVKSQEEAGSQFIVRLPVDNYILDKLNNLKKNNKGE